MKSNMAEGLKLVNHSQEIACTFTHPISCFQVATAIQSHSIKAKVTPQRITVSEILVFIVSMDFAE